MCKLSIQFWSLLLSITDFFYISFSPSLFSPTLVEKKKGSFLPFFFQCSKHCVVSGIRLMSLLSVPCSLITTWNPKLRESFLSVWCPVIYQGLCFLVFSLDYSCAAVAPVKTKRFSFRAASHPLVFLVIFEWEKNSFLKSVKGEGYLVCSEI